MSNLNLSDFFNGKMDDWIEKWELLNRTFGNKTLSVLLVDPNNEMPIEYVMQRHPNSRIKYIDLAKCCDGDYPHIEKTLEHGGYNGVLFDNIDEVGWIEDKADLEYLVKYSLKRDSLPFNDCVVDFCDLMVVCRCKEIPEYLKGQSLQMIIIEV